MDALENIDTKLDQLNAAITEETAQQAEVVAELKNMSKHDELSPEFAGRLQQLTEKLDASITRVKGIVPDATPAPAGPSAEPVAGASE